MNIILLHTGVVPADVNTILTFLPNQFPRKNIFSPVGIGTRNDRGFRVAARFAFPDEANLRKNQ